MADTDGGVKLGLHFDFDSIKKDINTLQRDLQTVSKNAANIYKNAGDSVNSYSGKLAKINEQLIRQSNAVKVLSDEMLRMLSGDVEPKSITTLEKELIAAQKELATLDKEFEKLAAEQQELADKNITIGGLSSLTPQELARFKELDQLIIDNGNRTEQTENKITSLDEKLTNLRLNPQLTPEFDALLAKLTEADAKMSRLQGDLDVGTAPTPPTPDAPVAGTGKFAMIQAAAERILPLLIQVGNAAKRAGNNLLSAFKNATSHIKIFNKDLNLGNNIVNKFMKRIKNMAINTFIFFQIRKAIRRMFATFADGFKQYAKFDKEFGNSIKNLKNTGVQLGNSIAAGFIPLIQALLPYLQQLVELMTKAADKMAQFIAALSGKQVYTKAKQVQDLKEGLDGVAESADEAKGSLAGFDQLNVQSMSKQDEAPKDYFETAAIDTSILDTVKDLNSLLDPLLEKLKQMKLDLGDAFKKVKVNFDLGDWGNLLTPLTNLLTKWLNDIDWNKIKTGAYLLGATLAQILNSVFADKLFADAIGHTIAEMINTGLSFADGFLDEFKFKEFGDFVGTMVNAFIRDFDWKLCGEVIGEGVNGATTAAIAFLDTVSFQRLGKSVGDMVQTAIDTTEFPKLGELGAKFLNSISESILGFFEGYEEGSFASGIAAAINSFFTNWNAADSAEAINTFLHAVFTEIQTLLEDTDWEMTGIKLGEFFAKLDIDQFMKDAGGTIEKLGKAIFKALLGAIIGASKDKTPDEQAASFAENLKKILFPPSIFKPFGDGIAKSLYDEIKKAWGEDVNSEPLTLKVDFMETLRLAKSDFTTWSNSIKTSFTNDLETMKLAFGFFVDDFLTVCTFLKDAVSWGLTNIIEKIITAVLNLATNIVTKFNDTKDKIISAWEYVSLFFGIVAVDTKQKFIDMFNSIKNGIKTPINGIISLVESMINFIIDGLGSLSDLISKNLKIQMPDIALLGDLSGKTIGFDLPKLSQIKIPRLAQGAVIPPQMSEFIATLGDNNRETEFVSPKSAMKEAFMEAIAEMGLDSGGTVNVYLQGDAEGLFKVVRTENSKWKKQHGGAGAF